ncbi:T9SS type A sorting domain-containing protein [Cellulophaga baltica]|uniref:T9SS type A sorting domain-containing protein n=1 Tax=Cellulophaga TaxID=104264 RepID=UPI001C07AE6F|nr:MULTISPECIES: T9SS type A sorting domain-containing protein [Cellulophaga]MBU2995542.1 T9SS type A sorting domain-containing protein [Cellulophaga baltica]MDO6766936.1 T9SS type A sorting domain-containing protein [Cellulophaga sp. 1_MG-2023]
MKKLYFILIFLFTTFAFAQHTTANETIDGFKIYPNPVTNGKVFISTTLNAPKKIAIYDILGTKIIETTIIGKELNLSNIDAGMYMLRVVENNKVATRKLIIK